MTAAGPAAVTAPSRRLHRPRRRPPWSVLFGGGIITVLALAALLAPVIAPYGPNPLDFLHALTPPSAQHLMGTDNTGRDVFMRLLYGLRIDLLVVVGVT